MAAGHPIAALLVVVLLATPLTASAAGEDLGANCQIERAHAGPCQERGGADEGAGGVGLAALLGVIALAGVLRWRWL